MSRKCKHPGVIVNLIYIKYAALCLAFMLGIQPGGQARARFCADHKEIGMVDVT